ncbi:MAG: hypothetical protein EPO38_12495 [Rhizorhabdus sp.]|nr:MAG: hypothetical protein EPO38_12495 [Rhizorhabdus sp.]
MNDSLSIPKWFWIVGALLLLWGAAGIFAFYSQLTTPYDQMVAEMGKAAADCIRDMPGWLWWVYGVAVWSGILGTIALLLRRAWARPLYLVSVIAVVVQFGHSFLIAKIQNVMGWSAAGFPAFIVAMGLFQLWFADMASKKGWLR